ncbi:hypothetical protein ACQJBY_015681 [Aegilops geniculata]
MATSIMASMALKSSPSPFSGQSQLQRIQPSARSSSFRVMSKKAKKVQTSQPFRPGGGLELKDGVDASGRPAKGKGVYQFASKYGANVDGYSPIYNPEEWSPSGDYYAGGKHRQLSGNNDLKALASVASFLWERNNIHALVYAGKTGLLLWVATLAGILLGGALLVYNTSALAS